MDVDNFPPPASASGTLRRGVTMLKPALSQMFRPDASLTGASNPGDNADPDPSPQRRGDDPQAI